MPGTKWKRRKMENRT